MHASVKVLEQSSSRHEKAYQSICMSIATLLINGQPKRKYQSG